MKYTKGFTLIEVLLALAIIAIGLTTMLKVKSQNISWSIRIKEKTISHWVAMQGINMIKLNLIHIAPNQEITEATELLGRKWFWRANILPTPLENMEKIKITVSTNINGPFTDPLFGFRESLK